MDIINWLKRSSTPAWAWMVTHYHRGDSYEPDFFRPENLERAINSLMLSWNPEQPVLIRGDMNLADIGDISDVDNAREIIKRKIMQELKLNPNAHILVDSESGYWKHSAELKKFDWEGSLK